jgi:hypothetical protein
MSMRGERLRFSARDVAELAILVVRTGDGLHTGILHRNRGQLYVLDQVWHKRLRGELLDRDYPCVVPSLEPEEINDLTATCRLIHTRRLQRGSWQELSYAFRYPAGTGVNKDGEIILGDGVGPTCATLIVAVFEAAKVPFVDLTGWVERLDDEPRFRRLLEFMRDGIPGFAPPAEPEHIARVEAELPCIRLRPEEAAAAGMTDRRPATFDQVERGGRWIVERLTVGAEHACK